MATKKAKLLALGYLIVIALLLVGVISIGFQIYRGDFL